MTATEQDRNRELMRRVYEALFDGDLTVFRTTKPAGMMPIRPSKPPTPRATISKHT